MSNLTVGNNANIDWSKIVADVMAQTEGLDGVNATTSLDGNNLTITLTDANGTSRSVLVEVPQLDEVDGEISPELLAQVEVKLEEAEKALQTAHAEMGEIVKTTGANAESTGVQKMLFDIYQLMNLMLQLAQTQRENAREVRNADKEVMLQAIHNQAESQRAAAKNGMILSLCFAAVQVVMLGLSSFMSGKAARAADKIADGTGLSQAQVDLKTLTNATTGAGATKQLDVATNALGGNEAAAKVQNELFPGVEDAKADLGNAQKSLNGLKAKQENLPEQIKLAKAAQQGLEKQLNGLDKSSEDYTKQSNELQGKIDKAVEEINGMQDELNGLPNKIEEAQTKVDDLRTKLNDKLDTGTTIVRSRMTAKENELQQAKANGADKAKIKQLKGELAELKKQDSYARAYSSATKQGAGMMKELADDMKAARGRFNDADSLVQHDAEYKAATARAKAWELLSQMAGIFGSMTQSITNLVTTDKQAKATDEQTVQKESEAKSDEMNEIFHNWQQLIQSVLDLIKAIGQAEASSMDQIIRAV